MKRASSLLCAFVLAFVVLALPARAGAQEITGTLSVTTDYPSRAVELGDSVTFSLDVAAARPQTVTLEMAELPDGWTATFRGGGSIIQSVFVGANAVSPVDLRLDPPDGVKAGTYNFTVLARSDAASSELPLTLIVQEEVPGSLTFESDLPTIKGSPTTTFRYTATLKNEADQDVTVNLSAETPGSFLARFKLSSQETSSFPLAANESKTVNIELEPLVDVPAGIYPAIVHADGGELQASLDLIAEVTGQSDLSVSGPDGRLSGRANAGRDSTLQIVITNNGTAPAQGVELTSTAPAGWTVTFDPEAVAEIPAGGQVDVTARVKPAAKAVSGDYMVTITARPAQGAQESADFRITVTTSTLWGIAGILLIAVAVGVVGMAVTRFGRR